MTPKQQQLFEARIRQWVTGCPICHQRNFTGPTIGAILAFKDGSVIIGGQLMPIVTMGCTTCGYVLCFSALQLGLVTPEGKDVE